MRKVKTLIIAKPSLVNAGGLWEIIKKADEKSLRLMGIKMMCLDIHKIEERSKESSSQWDEEKTKEAKKGLCVPCVLMAFEGEKASVVATEVKEMFKKNVHTSLNGEIASYEIQRFFSEKEIFEYDKVSENVFWGKESAQWKKYSQMSVLEIEKERKSEAKGKSKLK